MPRARCHPPRARTPVACPSTSKAIAHITAPAAPSLLLFHAASAPSSRAAVASVEIVATGAPGFRIGPFAALITATRKLDAAARIRESHLVAHSAIGTSASSLESGEKGPLPGARATQRRA
jgi:hypothetical protein